MQKVSLKIPQRPIAVGNDNYQQHHVMSGRNEFSHNETFEISKLFASNDEARLQRLLNKDIITESSYKQDLKT